MKKLFAIAGLGLLAASCTPKTVPTASSSSIKEDKLAQGKTLFDNSCGRCHDLPKPTDFTSVQWVGIMNSMAPKAKFNDEQHKLVYDYVVSVKK